MEIVTDRLILRPWQESDAESLYKYAQDPRIGPIAGWPPHTSVEDSLNIIRTVFAAPETYAVVLKETGEPVGSIGIMFGDGLHSAKMQADEAEIGYWLGVPYWGQELIPEAVRCLQKRCFEDLGMTTIWCGYYDGNAKSRRVMEKCGFRFHHTEEGKTSPLDEQESMIDRYLGRGKMFVMQNQAATPIAIAVVTDEGNGVLELKNLAVHPLFQRKGYGRRMIAYIREHYKDQFHTLLAGTGDSGQTFSFYKSCGFMYSHTVANFFLKNYDHPIMEDGKVLKDMKI